MRGSMRAGLFPVMRMKQPPMRARTGGHAYRILHPAPAAEARDPDLVDGEIISARARIPPGLAAGSGRGGGAVVLGPGGRFRGQRGPEQVEACRRGSLQRRSASGAALAAQRQRRSGGVSTSSSSGWVRQVDVAAAPRTAQPPTQNPETPNHSLSPPQKGANLLN